jgi:hypothetical protein
VLCSGTMERVSLFFSADVGSPVFRDDTLAVRRPCGETIDVVCFGTCRILSRCRSAPSHLSWQDDEGIVLTDEPQTVLPLPLSPHMRFQERDDQATVHVHDTVSVPHLSADEGSIVFRDDRPSCPPSRGETLIEMCFGTNEPLSHCLAPS